MMSPLRLLRAARARVGPFTRMPRGQRNIAALALAVTTLLVAAPPAAARDAVVNSFDGTPIQTSFFPAAGLKPGQRAPTVLVGHGWGEQRQTDPGMSSEDIFGRVGIGPLIRAGFNVLTWDARGWWNSGGTASVDGPDFEGRDVQALISYVARQPEAQLDRANDPRVGMTGASYAGGIQLVAAALDGRIDAINPIIAWNSLVTSLFKDGAGKGGWGSLLIAAAVPGTRGRVDPHTTSAFASIAASGTLSDEDRRWFESRGPGALVNRIRVPTLISQGTVDTLFTLKEAMVNFDILRRNGVPVKMLWFCGGHGACLGPRGPGGLTESRAVAWLRRHLKRENVSTGAQFEWVADDGVLRSAAGFPLTPRTPLVGTGSGTLAASPDAGSSGGAIFASPAANAVNVSVAPPTGAATLVGEPKLTLVYSGLGSAQSSHVFAQIVDTERGLVLGNQTTPIPVTLDGQPHTVSRPLEAVAAQAGPGSRYLLQLTPATSVYAPQHDGYTINFPSIRVELPVVDPTKPLFGVAGSGRASCGSVSLGRNGRRLGIRPGALTNFARARRVPRRGRLYSKVCAPQRVRRMRLELLDGRGKVVGRSGRYSFSGRRTISIRLVRRIVAGRYTLRGTGVNPNGRSATLSQGIRLR
jgi:ABC-2 type transport system ATP-binding protein